MNEGLIVLGTWLWLELHASSPALLIASAVIVLLLAVVAAAAVFAVLRAVLSAAATPSARADRSLPVVQAPRIGRPVGARGPRAPGRPPRRPTRDLVAG